MTRLAVHSEFHHISRIGWLRAAILGANDGIVSTASLIVGVAAANAAQSSILVSGVAGLVAGAMSMAAGEYVSVSSQSDTEKADLARERKELETAPVNELAELVNIYVGRGLTPSLAVQVAHQLMANDALGAHARDELGISEATAARPIQAAWTSALSFSLGAIFPIIVVLIAPAPFLVWGVAVASLAFLAWRDRRPGRRRQHLGCHGTRRLLGSGGHGNHGGNRQLIRQGGLSRESAVHLPKNSTPKPRFQGVCICDNVLYHIYSR